MPAAERSGAAGGPLIRRASLALALALFVAANALVLRYEDDLMRIAAYDNQYTPAHLVDYENGPTPEVVFLGSSRVAAGFAPSLMRRQLRRGHDIDARGVNLGIASGNLESSYMILKNVIRDSRKPALVVYGLSEHELLPNLDLTQLPYTEQLMVLEDFPEHSGETLRSKLGFLLERLVPIYRDRTLLRDAFSIRFNEDDRRHAAYEDGPGRLVRPPDGFWPLVGTAPAELIRVQRRLFGLLLGGYAVSGEAVQKLEHLIDLARRRGIRIVLVNMPSPPIYRALWGSERAIRDYRAVVRTIARRKGVRLVDLYESSPDPIPLGGFYDVNHLNPIGAAYLTAVVTERLIAPALKPSVRRAPSSARQARVPPQGP